MPDSLKTMITAFRIKDQPFEPDWKGEDIIRNVRTSFLSADQIADRRKVGRPRKDPPMPPDPRRFDAQILLGYHGGLTLDEIAKRAGCDVFHVMRRIAYHTS